MSDDLTPLPSTEPPIGLTVLFYAIRSAMANCPEPKPSSEWMDAASSRIATRLMQASDEVTPRPGLIDRLRGIYVLRVDPTVGPLDGKDTFTRYFPTAPIQHEAADRIERLEAELATFMAPSIDAIVGEIDNTKVAFYYHDPDEGRVRIHLDRDDVPADVLAYGQPVTIRLITRNGDIIPHITTRILKSQD